MRRFSQRNSLVTLNEINITPLLDLAFVLLLIFIITRPMLENSLDLKLPPGGRPVGKVEQKDIKTVEITPAGTYKLNGKFMRAFEVINQLDQSTKENPNTVVAIRAHEDTPHKHVIAIVDGCQKRGINRYSIRTAPN